MVKDIRNFFSTWAACLISGVLVALATGCGSQSQTTSTPDLTSLASVTATWAKAQKLDGTQDVSALMSIRNPNCPETQYRQWLESTNDKAKRSGLTPSRSALPSNLHPVTATYHESGAPRFQSKSSPVSEVPTSGIAPGVNVIWGTTNVINPQTPQVTHGFVLLTGKWYDANCPVVSRAQQVKINKGE